MGVRTAFRVQHRAAWLAVLVCAGACSTAPPPLPPHQRPADRFLTKIPPKTPAPAPTPAPEIATHDPAKILDIVRAREDTVQTLRATFETTTSVNGEVQRTTDGILLVRKPDAFRLRLTTPLGLTAFDYLSRPDGVHVVFPYGNGASGESPLPFSEDDLREIFLRGELAFPGRCAETLAPAGELVVDCRTRSDVLLRTLVVDPSTGRIREERSYRDGKLHLLLENDDYRAAETADLPYRIVLTYPSTGTRMEILIRRYEVNAPLDERHFAPVGG